MIIRCGVAVVIVTLVYKQLTLISSKLTHQKNGSWAITDPPPKRRKVHGNSPKGSPLFCKTSLTTMLLITFVVLRWKLASNSFQNGHLVNGHFLLTGLKSAGILNWRDFGRRAYCTDGLIADGLKSTGKFYTGIWPTGIPPDTYKMYMYMHQMYADVLGGRGYYVARTPALTGEFCAATAARWPLLCVLRPANSSTRDDDVTYMYSRATRVMTCRTFKNTSDDVTCKQQQAWWCATGREPVYQQCIE